MRRNLQSVLVVGILVLAAFSVVGIVASAKPTMLGDQLKSIEEPKADTTPTWTVIVYLDGDNNLESYAILDLEEMESIGSKNDVTVLVLMDTLSYFDTKAHWYIVEPGSDHVNVSDGRNSCDCDKVVGSCPGELNMGSGANLDYAVETAVKYAPADNYLLVLWDHGGGWKGVCYDDSSPYINGFEDRLSTNETADALMLAQTNIRASGIDPDFQITILAYDACLNGMVEVVYENRFVAEYMIASITLIPGDGYPYDKVLENLTQIPRLSVVEFGKNIVDTYVEYYSICAGAGINYFGDVELSLFDLSKVGALVTSVNALATELIKGGYLDDSSYRGAIESAESQTPRIEYMGEHFPFVDLGSYANLLGEKIPALKPLTDAVVAGVTSTVVHYNFVQTDSGAIMKTTGITVYFTCCWNYLSPYYPLITEESLTEAGVFLVYGMMDFVVDTNWDEFVYTFSQVYVMEE